MAKPIRINEDWYEQIIEDVRRSLANARAADGKFKYEYSLTKKDKAHTEICFTPGAFIKMRSLVDGFTTEVGWHGVAKRTETGFLVEDIFVYPQTVTGATVVTDDAEIAKWMNELPDEQFNNLRFHGHSHVNFGVTPSSTDMAHREGILSQLKDDDFYIFVIVNKRGEWSASVYDMKENILYETGDVDICVIDVPEDTLVFYENAKKLVKQKTVPAGAVTKIDSQTAKAPKAKKKKDPGYGFLDDYEDFDDFLSSGRYSREYR